MKRSRYHIRVMRPTFQRAILTVEATSEEAALRSALQQAERLTERDWMRLEAEREPPVIEVALLEEESEGQDEGDVLRSETEGGSWQQRSQDVANGVFAVLMERPMLGQAVSSRGKRLKPDSVLPCTSGSSPPQGGSWKVWQSASAASTVCTAGWTLRRRRPADANLVAEAASTG